MTDRKVWHLQRLSLRRKWQLGVTDRSREVAWCTILLYLYICFMFYCMVEGVLKIWWVTGINVHQENKGKCKYQGKINLFVYMKSNKLRKISNSLCYYIHMYIHTLTLTHSLTHLTHSRTDARMYAWMHGTIHQIWMQVWSHRHKRMFLVRLGVSGGCTLWVN